MGDKIPGLCDKHGFTTSIRAGGAVGHDECPFCKVDVLEVEQKRLQTLVGLSDRYAGEVRELFNRALPNERDFGGHSLIVEVQKLVEEIDLLRQLSDIRLTEMHRLQLALEEETAIRKVAEETVCKLGGGPRTTKEEEVAVLKEAGGDVLQLAKMVLRLRAQLKSQGSGEDAGRYDDSH